MRTAQGLVLALGIFAASFALHIVGGATDQGWLFGLAVVLIYISASGFGAIAWLLAGAREGDRLTLVIGSLAALALTVSALWAANDRAFAWWQAPVAPVLVVITSGAIYGGWLAWRKRRVAPGSAAAEGSR
ncbi:MAG: hypothetical protein U5Q44_12345 [Dehalococcoidia bacterium]|nr:hypothetical protein [Dehalococcoidia bacterium]